jgi:hypothetical protein
MPTRDVKTAPFSQHVSQESANAFATDGLCGDPSHVLHMRVWACTVPKRILLWRDGAYAVIHDDFVLRPGNIVDWVKAQSPTVSSKALLRHFLEREEVEAAKIAGPPKAGSSTSSKAVSHQIVKAMAASQETGGYCDPPPVPRKIVSSPVYILVLRQS